MVVGDQNGGHLDLVVKPAQPCPQILSDLGVECAERLVEQQHLGVHRQSPRQRHALSLSARQLCGITGLEPSQAHDLEQLVDLRLDLVLGPLTDLEPERHVVPHRHVLEGRVMLEHESDVAPLW